MNNPGFRGYDNRSVGWMTEFFKAPRWRVSVPTWNLTLDQLVTIWQSRLATKTKIGLLGTEAKASWWRRRFLVQELGAAGRMLVGTVLGGPR